MRAFRTTRRVRHAAVDMFNLVADVERYPQFVPLCEQLVVRKRDPADAEREILVADMTVAYKLIRETFTSRVTLDKRRLEILVEYLDGPFRSLENRWNFRPEGARACDVTFDIQYEFRSRMLSALMGTVFDAAFRRFAEAFERRADEMYGRPADA
jgi:coenzyme Q-binding protein COQ10